LPETPQPTQRQFDTRLWQALRALDPQRPVWVESESRRIGRVHLPEQLIARMRASERCIHLILPAPARVALLLEDYAHLTRDLPGFEALLAALVPLRGHERVEHWCRLAREGRWAEAFEALMVDHYDPGYLDSMRRNFAGFARAEPVEAPDGSSASLLQLASALVAREPPRDAVPA
jgi:tRNA 2-selenouridine synthase